MNFSWNKSNGGGESLITYTNQGGGSNIRFGIGYWNNSTYSEQFSIASSGAATFSSSVDIGQSATVRGFTGTTGAGMFMAYGSAGAGIGSIYSYNYGTSTYGGTVIDGSYVAFYNSGSEKMRVTGGNVGIGTTSPARKLTVVSDNIGIRMDNSSNTNGGLEYFFNGSVYNWLVGAQYNVSNAFEITPSTAVGGTTYSTPAFVVNANGNVGIGTTSPTTNLQVYQTGGAGNNYVEGTIQVGGTSSTLGGAFSYAAQNSGYVNITNLNNGGGANARISFGFGAITSGLPANNVMTINQSGNVGIGTTSPTAKLEVVGGTINNQIARFITADFPTHSIGLGVDGAGSEWGALYSKMM